MSDEVPAWRKENVKIEFDLTGGEMVWRNRQKMLERYGYMLRPRFRPGWVPSWLNTDKESYLCEDSLYNPQPTIIDATRLSDGMQVAIKIVSRSSVETSIGVFLSSGDNSRDSTNHCIPVLQVLQDESLPAFEFIVMPLLRPFNDPPFFDLEEVLDFMKQSLEGLAFMHKVGVAHRDCSNSNIMFDAAGMYPKGFHASVWNLDATSRPAQPLRRRDVSSVKYYFTDFGLSTRFHEGESRLVSGSHGLDQDVPELNTSEVYDPFPVDIFILGNVFRRNFTQKFTNMKFLIPLVESMTKHEPLDRPPIEEALSQFNKLVSGTPGYTLRWRLQDVEKGRISYFIQNAGSLRRECIYILKDLLRRVSHQTA